MTTFISLFNGDIMDIDVKRAECCGHTRELTRLIHSQQMHDGFIFGLQVDMLKP